MKKGISPLIATVLLIGFTVALAAVVIKWGGDIVNRSKDTSEGKIKELDCLFDVEFKIIQALENSGNVDFKISNDGSLEMRGFIVRLYNDAGDVEVNKSLETLTDGLVPFAVGSYSVTDPFVAAGGSAANKIEIFPIVISDDERVACRDQLEERFVEVTAPSP